MTNHAYKAGHADGTNGVPVEHGLADFLRGNPAGQERALREALERIAVLAQKAHGDIRRHAAIADIKVIAAETLAALPHQPATDEGEGEWLTKRVAEVVAEDGGCWSACSGCQESVDGYVSSRDYPYSRIFKCQPGSGCRECGGLGVIWQDGAFLASYGEALSTPTTQPPAAETRLREPFTHALASLVAAISILRRAHDEHKEPRKVVASDKMFLQMLADYEAAAANARDTLTQPEPTAQQGGGEADVMRERVVGAVFAAMSGTGADPFATPEAWDFATEIADAALRAIAPSGAEI